MTMFGMTLEPQWWWLVLAALLGIAEMIVPGVFLIWIGMAAALTGLATMAVGLPMAAQFALFTIAAFGAVFAGRRFLHDNPIATSDPLLNDRAARLIGETVVVVEAIDGGRGRVRVGDGVWPARGPDLPPGAKARVTGSRDGLLEIEAF